MTQRARTALIEQTRAMSAALASLFFLAVGTAVAAAFHLELYLNIRPAVVVFAGLTIVALVSAKISKLSLLPRFLIALYALPFSALVGYLFSLDFAWIFTPTGYDIIQDSVVVRQMIATGTVGLCGLAAGINAARVKHAPQHDVGSSHDNALHTLSLGSFGLLLIVALVVSWLSAPAETIFEKAYMTDQAITAATRINFPAASLVSYILIVCLAVDIERERVPSARGTKLVALALGTAYIVLVLQILRGDRESSGLVVALACLYLTSPIRAPFHFVAGDVRKRIRRVAFPLLLALVIFVWLGAARSLLIEGTQAIGLFAMLQLGLSQNTWTAVLWRNLGTAWEYRHGLLHYKLGETYLQYLLSLPPGIVTKAFGVDRPLEAWQGIGFEDPAGISAGGLHVVIAPFKNFGMVGAFCVLFLYGWIAGRLEIRNIQPSLMIRLLWASTICAGFLWFWYGDMPFIRAMMVSVVLYWMYRLALSLRWVTAPITASHARAPDLASVPGTSDRQ